MSKHNLRENHTAVLALASVGMSIVTGCGAKDAIDEMTQGEKQAARANMQVISNANQSHKLQTMAFAKTMSELTDLPAPITGPGNRQYEFVAAGTQCDHDGDSGTPPVAIPAGSFGVRSTVEADGCYIPGMSPNPK